MAAKVIEFKWEKCDGEAHSNAHIDNCGLCMPFWGKYPVAVNAEDVGRTVHIVSGQPEPDGRAFISALSAQKFREELAAKTERGGRLPTINKSIKLSESRKTRNVKEDA